MLAKIEGDAVQRALELAGVQFIDADDSAARVCACGGTELSTRAALVWGTAPLSHQQCDRGTLWLITVYSN